jgi:hypothetical protein
LINEHFKKREEAIKPSLKEIEKNIFLDTHFDNLYGSLKTNETKTMNMFINESKALKMEYLHDSLQKERDKLKMKSQMDIVVHNAEETTSELYTFQVQ